MGLEMLLGPLLGKVLIGVAAAVGALALYFGIKAKGAREQREKTTRATFVAQQEAQRKLDDARADDRAVDERTRERLEKLGAPEPPKPPPAKPGDRFQFAWLAAVLLLSACAGGVTAVPLVTPDVPPRPFLAACAPAPHPAGRVVEHDGGRFVELPLDDALAVQTYLREGPRCAATREALLEGHIEKLENRLRALGGR